MICPNCGSFWPEADRFCSNCGTPLLADAAPAPAVRKGRRWVPAVLLAMMAVLGTIVYFAIRLPSNSQAPSSEAPWFTMEGNTLVNFDPGAYTGSSDLTVPATIDGMQVLSIGDGCFYGCDDLTSVKLPEGLEAIGDYAFAECSAMRGMYTPESVTAIGAYAFYRCSSMEAICLTGYVQSIGESAFSQCDSLIYVFYTGQITQWQALYSDYINPFTYIFCSDGSYPQGGSID